MTSSDVAFIIAVTVVNGGSGAQSDSEQGQYEAGGSQPAAALAPGHQRGFDPWFISHWLRLRPPVTSVVSTPGSSVTGCGSGPRSPVVSTPGHQRGFDPWVTGCGLGPRFDLSCLDHYWLRHLPPVCLVTSVGLGPWCVMLSYRPCPSGHETGALAYSGKC